MDWVWLPASIPLSTCFHSNSKPEFHPERCVPLPEADDYKQFEAGRKGTGVIVKSMTQLLRSGYNKNQLEPIRPKMAEDWISSGP